jgi:hypothetical protein
LTVPVPLPEMEIKTFEASQAELEEYEELRE